MNNGEEIGAVATCAVAAALHDAAAFGRNANSCDCLVARRCVLVWRRRGGHAAGDDPSAARRAKFSHEEVMFVGVPFEDLPPFVEDLDGYNGQRRSCALSRGHAARENCREHV